METKKSGGKKISVGVLFVVAALFFVLAAVIPVLRDRPMNVTFFVIGMMWLIIGFTIVNANRKSEEPDAATAEEARAVAAVPETSVPTSGTPPEPPH